MYLIYN